MKHATFNSPQMLNKYSDETFRIIYNERVSIGDRLIANWNNNGKLFEKECLEVIEERSSDGDFDKYETPFSYRLRMTA